MTRTKSLKALAVAAALPLLYFADSAPDVGWTLMREAHAVVGAPLTPVSGAGVARRTTRRVVAAESAAAQSQSASAAAVQQQQAATAKQQEATAKQQAETAKQQEATAKQQAAAAARPPGAPAAGTVVTALPAGCKPETKGDVQYQNCGGVLYRTAFQGNNLVYVVQ